MFSMIRNGFAAVGGWFIKPSKPCLYDRQLVWIAIALMITGLVMVTSASVPVATRLTGIPFYFAYRHAFFLFGAICIAAIVLQIPLAKWKQYSFQFLLY